MRSSAPPALISIFAVDDEPHNLELIARTFPDQSIETYEDPRKALIAARRVRPAILLTDFRMPHLTGVELIRTLQADGLSFVALMITAYADFEEVLEAKRDNLMFSILVKPWKPIELRDQVKLATKFHRLNQSRSEMNSLVGTEPFERRSRRPPGS